MHSLDWSKLSRKNNLCALNSNKLPKTAICCSLDRYQTLLFTRSRSSSHTENTYVIINLVCIYIKPAIQLFNILLHVIQERNMWAVNSHASPLRSHCSGCHLSHAISYSVTETAATTYSAGCSPTSSTCSYSHIYLHLHITQDPRSYSQTIKLYTLSLFYLATSGHVQDVPEVFKHPFK